MRIPKFQAWHKAQRKMQPVLAIELDPEFGGVEVWGKPYTDFLTGEHWADKDLWTWDDIELRQSTGMLDRNGKDTYEGDIVEYDAIGGRGVVTWEPSHPGFIIFGENEEGRAGYVLHNDWVVIGNKFEHPELLEGGK